MSWTEDIQAKNVIKSLTVQEDLEVGGEIRAKNACTAWVNFDGTTTPPTIRDSFNVKDVVRVGTGVYDVYFEEDMNTNHYSFNSQSDSVGLGVIYSQACRYLEKNKIQVYNYYEGSNEVDPSTFSLQIFGGK